MNGGKDEVEDVSEDELSEQESPESEAITDADDDNVGDLSVELNVEELVAKIEEEDAEEVHRKSELRRKLEIMQEQHDAELDSTYNFNLDDDV